MILTLLLLSQVTQEQLLDRGRELLRQREAHITEGRQLVKQLDKAIERIDKEQTKNDYIFWHTKCAKMTEPYKFCVRYK